VAARGVVLVVQEHAHQRTVALAHPGILDDVLGSPCPEFVRVDAPERLLATACPEHALAVCLRPARRRQRPAHPGHVVDAIAARPVGDPANVEQVLVADARAVDVEARIRGSLHHPLLRLPPGVFLHDLIHDDLQLHRAAEVIAPDCVGGAGCDTHRAQRGEQN